MSALKHKTGGFRAYKKINGTEYQFYSHDEDLVKAKQSEYEEMSRVFKSLTPPRLFSSCGRLLGVRVYDDDRPSKARRTKMIVQLSKGGKQYRREKVYKGKFEVIWLYAKEKWQEHFNLTVLDMADYREEMIRAKRLYMQDLYLIE